jgi:PQQ-dependent dehydrogenase (s-GDH family)
LAAGAEDRLYAAEHGPKTDDEINLIEAGHNYGWPHVAGYQDDQAYAYANWSAAEGCDGLQYNDFEIPETVPQQRESDWSHPDFTPPLHTFGTVPTGTDFQIAECAENYFICWPTVAPSGVEIYRAQSGGIPGWPASLLISALKTGTVYRMALSADGASLRGDAIPYFKTTNRYRDLAISPNGRTFYIVTDNDNYTQDVNGLPTDALEHRGAILEFRYISPG